MEKEIFFLFNPDVPETTFDKKVKYRSALPQTAAGKRVFKKENPSGLQATIRKVFCPNWWN